MTPERWGLITELFHATLERDPDRRDAFLREACGSDAELRAEVDSLLAGDQQAAERGDPFGVASPPLTAGTSLGPYQIETLLDAGGMGEVYRARDTRLRRDVAVKVLPVAHAADRSRLRRFEQEALAAAALNHPNILAVYDVGTENGRTYLVSELLTGQTLRESLRKGALSLRKTLDYAIQTANGLAAAHEKGIIHRDIKPENLFVTTDGRVKILDFGLAKLHRTLDPDDAGSAGATMSELTDVGVVLGTASYMSPEQVQGHRVDQRSDIFSFGTVLHEMLTGTCAFRRNSSVETMNAILKEEPGELAQPGKEFPPILERIVKRCLEKNPDARFRSAQDLAFALDTVSGSSGTGVKVATDKGTITRRRLLLAVAGLAVLVALPALGFLTGSRMAERPVPAFQRLTFRRGGPFSARFTPDGRAIVYAAAWDGDPIRLFSTRIERPESAAIDSPDAELEAVSASGELLITLDRQQGDFWSDGSWTLARLPLAGGAPRLIAEHVRGADWGPNGAIALIRHNRLEYPVGHVLYESAKSLDSPRVSPAGDQVAFFESQNGTTVSVVDRSGVKRTLSTGWKWFGKHLVWSLAGDEVWFAASEGGYTWPLRAVSLSGRQRVLLRLPNGLIPQDVSLDGRLLLSVSSGRYTIKCLPPGESRERDLSWFESSIGQDLSRDGKTLLFVEVGGGAGPGPEAAAYLRGTDGSPPVRLADSFPVALSPDGRWVVTDSQRTRERALLPTGPGEPRPLDLKGLKVSGWFPDSRRLLLYGRQAGAQMRCYSLDIDTGKAEPVAPEGFDCPLGPSPDGTELLLTDGNGAWKTYSVTTGAARPVSGMATGEYPLQWGADGRSLFVQREGLPLVKIDRLDLRTGQRRPWREIALADPAGLNRAQSGLLLAPNGSYCYSYQQTLGDLYLVDGVR